MAERFGKIQSELSIGAGQSVRRNAGDSAFEAYTPATGVDVGDAIGSSSDDQFIYVASGNLAQSTNAQFDGTRATLAEIEVPSYASASQDGLIIEPGTASPVANIIEYPSDSGWETGIFGSDVVGRTTADATMRLQASQTARFPSQLYLDAGLYARPSGSTVSAVMQFLNNTLSIQDSTATIAFQFSGGNSGSGYYGDYKLSVGGGSRELNFQNQLTSRSLVFLTGGSDAQNPSNDRVGVGRTAPGAKVDIQPHKSGLGVLYLRDSSANLIAYWDSTYNFTLAESRNIVTGTTTGSQIGTGSTQKTGLWGATPIVRPSALTAKNTNTADCGDGDTDAIIDNNRTRIEELETRLSNWGFLP